MKRFNELLYWMDEREQVRERKEAGLPWPWSVDPVFEETYFCNVYRETDRVTRWIRENWPMANGPAIHTVAMGVARFVNKPETLQVLGYPYSGFNLRYCDQFVKYMGSKKKVWNGAYIVSTNGNSQPKEEYIAGVLTGLSNAAPTLHYPGLAGTHAQLIELMGIGSFMSAQIIADLKNTPGHPLYEAPDWFTWCAHGPGSLKGLAWVMGDEDKRMTPTRFYSIFPQLHEQISEAGWKIHAQDLQNCLCEFDKYCRVKNGTGRSKRKYVWNRQR